MASHNLKKTLNLLGMLAALSAPLALAMEADRPERLPEEIVVTSQRLLFDLQRRVHEAEEKMYGMFNELNDDNKYDILCHTQTRINSHIDARECRPRFFDRAAEDIAEGFYLGGGFTFSAPPLQAVAEYHYPILKEKLREAAAKSPEFLDAIIEHHELQTQLAERKRTHFGEE